MTSTDNSTFVKISPNAVSDDICELPCEENGTILVTTLKGQYPRATGLKYKLENGEWSELSEEDGVLSPPEGGWGENQYVVIANPTKLAADRLKRIHEGGSDDTPSKRRKDDRNSSDLIVLGISYSASEDDVKEYFEKFGELEMHEIKRQPDGKSKGFGFIRFKTKEVAQKVLKLNHSIAGRRCEVKLPKKMEDSPTKLFIGRLKEGTTAEDLKEYFSTFGDLKDVYIPKNFRGFGFVTFESQYDAQDVMKDKHSIKGSAVNVNYADPKTSEHQSSSYSQQNYGSYGGGGYSSMNSYGGNRYNSMNPYGGNQFNDMSSFTGDRFDNMNSFDNGRFNSFGGGGRGQSFSGSRY